MRGASQVLAKVAHTTTISKSVQHIQKTEAATSAEKEEVIVALRSKASTSISNQVGSRAYVCRLEAIVLEDIRLYA